MRFTVSSVALLCAFIAVCSALSILTLGVGWLLSLIPEVHFGHGLIAGAILTLGSVWILLWTLLNHSMAQILFSNTDEDEFISH